MTELKGFKSLTKTHTKKAGNIEHDVVRLPVEFLYSSKLQPRTIFSDPEIKELSDSISQNGILQPIIVRKVDDKYEIVAGERRWRAAKLAGLASVPVIVREFDDEKSLFVALTENLQREDLLPLEEAEAYSELANNYSLTHEKISEILGKSRVTITNTIRLLSLSNTVKEFLRSGQITTGHAKALLKLKLEDQDIAVQHIIQKQLNVRYTEDYANKFYDIKKGESKQFYYSPELILRTTEILAVRINKKFNLKQNVNDQKVKIMIEFETLEEVEEFFTD